MIIYGVIAYLGIFLLTVGYLISLKFGNNVSKDNELNEEA